ncbi:MAG TPA: hypothetical protein VFO34_04990 [Candidatus Acidoferrales bacterium]|nr:hypothetical protein [Candidatus Acidoferrales bacterium]
MPHSANIKNVAAHFTAAVFLIFGVIEEADLGQREPDAQEAYNPDNDSAAG